MNFGGLVERKYKILVIEDNAETLDLLREILAKQFEVITALDGVRGLDLASVEHPELILLDLFLPGLSGIEVCCTLRSNENTRDIPIIIVTGSISDEAREQAFLSGADDFMLKPFHSKELIARVASKIRRIEELRRQDEVLSCGNLALNSSKLEVTIQGEPIRLSMLEFSLLKYFVMNKDRVLSRAQILDAVWPDSSVSDRTIDTHIVSLRKKLVRCDHAIATVYGAGYVLEDASRSSRKRA